MSMRNSNQEFTEMRANGSNNNTNYFYNSEMREHMFDKVLTPSDVGKLNRLVIPKQHAESYFSLDDENQKETVLDFQDINGKMWRFRYCYWNSSQSYVITRGWNRFVKEKKLIAGDIASFHRGYITDESEQRKQIMFIDWRHRVDINNIHQHNYIFGSPAYLTEYSMPSYRSFPPFYQGREYLGHGYGRIVNGGRFYAGSPLDHQRPGRSEPLVYDSVPVFPMPTQPSTVKKLRLFGVDVEESSSSGEARGDMGVLVGYNSSSPVVIRDDDQSWRSPLGEVGASSSSVMQQSDDEEYKRKGKSSMF